MSIKFGDEILKEVASCKLQKLIHVQPSADAARKLFLTGPEGWRALFNALQGFNSADIGDKEVLLHSENANLPSKLSPQEFRVLARSNVVRVADLTVRSEAALDGLQLRGETLDYILLSKLHLCVELIDLSMCNTQGYNVSHFIKENSDSLKVLIKPSVETLSRSQLPSMELDLLSVDELPRGVQRKRALLSTLSTKRFEYKCSSTDSLLHFVYWLRAEEFCVSSHFSMPTSSVGVNITLKRFELRLEDFEEFGQIGFLPLLRRFAVAFPNLEHLDIFVDDCRAYQEDDMIAANAAVAKYVHFVTFVETDLEAAQDAATRSSIRYRVSFKSNFECTLETMYDYRNALVVNDAFELTREFTASGSLGPVEEVYERLASFGPQNDVTASICITYVWPPEKD